MTNSEHFQHYFSVDFSHKHLLDDCVFLNDSTDKINVAVKTQRVTNRELPMPLFSTFFPLTDQYFALWKETVNATKQVPNKHDTSSTVLSILPPATFHQQLMKLVDSNTLRANRTLVSVLTLFHSHH